MVVVWETCPNPGMAGAFQRYFDYHISPGSFGTALLALDIHSAMSRADHNNQRLLGELIEWLDKNAPREAWGSWDKVNNWLANVR